MEVIESSPLGARIPSKSGSLTQNLLIIDYLSSVFMCVCMYYVLFWPICVLFSVMGDNMR